MSERRALIDREDAVPVVRQCRLLDISRSTAYYDPQGLSEEDLALSRQIDEIHLEFAFYGSRRIRDELRDRGHHVNRKRVQRLMRLSNRCAALFPRSLPWLLY